MNNKQTGFSLVELSIVLVIIGLLVAGVSTSSILLKQAKLRAIITEVKHLQTSINTFVFLYKALPGDYSNASTLWSGAKDGDGNLQIEGDANSAGTGSSEAGTAFTHLHLADVISGDFEVGNVLLTNPKMSFPSRYKGGAYILTYYTPIIASPINRNHIAGNTTNVIRIGKISTSITQVNTHVGYGLLTVEDAKDIDKKMDDGLARSGHVSGHNQYISGFTTGVGCLKFPSGTTSDATGAASYNLDTTHVCNMSFDIQTSLDDD